MIKLIAQLRNARISTTAALLCAFAAPQWSAAQTIGVAPGPTPGVVAPLQEPEQKPFSQIGPHPVTHAVTKPVERIEMIVNTSRILTQEQRIPQAQVNNPEILGLTALSANQIQIYGRRAGVTQVNIWDEKGGIHSIDVMVYGDVQELARVLQDQFPKAALKLTPISTGVLIQGYVDDPGVQSRIVEIAQTYYPNVINNITVGGVQQVLLQVRVLEVSRTKLQSLGVDMAAILENGSFFASGAAGILRPQALTAAGAAATSGVETLAARIANDGDQFFFFVEALKRNNLAKIMADPNLVTVSGRPAFMNAGGEFPIAVPQSLGTISIEYRRFGTQVDFVPIVLGNGVIRLEMRPRISEIDESRSIVLAGTTVPGLRVREFDTAAELRAGQTLVVAGLVQTRNETSVRGVPWLMDTPYVGSLFRRTSDQINEIELIMMVTPQFVDGLDPQDLCNFGPGPGSVTTNPGDCQLFYHGHIEVCPDNRRPAHFQQPWPIGAQGGAAAGSNGPAGVMTEAPALEPIPAAPKPQIDLNAVPPRTGGQPPAASRAGSEIRIHSATQSRDVTAPATIPMVSAPSGSATTIPSLPAVPSLQSDSTSLPGMAGPIGYEK